MHLLSWMGSMIRLDESTNEAVETALVHSMMGFVTGLVACSPAYGWCMIGDGILLLYLSLHLPFLRQLLRN